MTTERSNEASYNNSAIVDYYSDFTCTGLFHYEELLIDKYFTSGGKTLDVGCGAGRTTIPLFEKGYKVIGLDFAEKMIMAAKSLNSTIDYRVGNILSTRFDDQEFDNILFSFNGLMLLGTYGERLKAVKEIRRILKSEGNFIFTTPYLDNKILNPYWLEKASSLDIDVQNMTWDQQLELGDEQLEDYGSDFFLHVPFISEVEKMIDEAEMKVLFLARRLDYSRIEELEDELDDNCRWVAACKK